MFGFYLTGLSVQLGLRMPKVVIIISFWVGVHACVYGFLKKNKLHKVPLLPSCMFLYAHFVNEKCYVKRKAISCGNPYHECL